jgi:hypothetical protein
MPSPEEQLEIEQKINECLDKYYELKAKYENANLARLSSQKKKTDKKTSGKKTTIYESETKNKCVNCEREVGNIIGKRVIFNENSSHNFQTEYIFKCGDTTNPCGLNIHFYKEDTFPFSYLLNDYRKTIDKLKKDIIILKNNVLFKYNEDDNTFNKFQETTKLLKDEIETYNMYLERYINQTDNPLKRIELKERLNSFGILLNAFKILTKEISEDDSKINVSVEFYINELKPLAELIRKLTYSSNNVIVEKDYYVLKQLPVSLEQELYQMKYDKGDLDYYIPSFKLGNSLMSGKKQRKLTKKSKPKTTMTKTRKSVPQEPIVVEEEAALEEEIDIDIPASLPPVTNRPTIAKSLSTPVSVSVLPKPSIVLPVTTNNIYQVELQTNGTTITTKINSNQIKPSGYHIFSEKERELLKYLRQNYGNTSIICIWYGNDTQFAISESPKVIDKTPVETAKRGILEETGLDIPVSYYKQFGNIFISQKIRGVKNIAMFSVNLNEAESEIHITKDTSKYDAYEDATDENAVKALIGLVGTQEIILEFLKNVKPNENIHGYHVIPINDPVLDKLIG